MKETGKSLSELAAEVTIYPQKLVNIRVENAMKEKAMEVPAIKAIIEKMEEEMAGEWPYSGASKWNRAPLACYGRSSYNRRSGLLC